MLKFWFGTMQAESCGPMSISITQQLLPSTGALVARCCELTQDLNRRWELRVLPIAESKGSSKQWPECYSSRLALGVIPGYKTLSVVQ